jgi:hypothetical protein
MFMPLVLLQLQLRLVMWLSTMSSKPDLSIVWLGVHWLLLQMVWASMVVLLLLCLRLRYEALFSFPLVSCMFYDGCLEGWACMDATQKDEYELYEYLRIQSWMREGYIAYLQDKMYGSSGIIVEIALIYSFFFLFFSFLFFSSFEGYKSQSTEGRGGSLENLR